jgi:hypothetical protein
LAGQHGVDDALLLLARLAPLEGVERGRDRLATRLAAARGAGQHGVDDALLVGGRVAPLPSFERGRDRLGAALGAGLHGVDDALLVGGRVAPLHSFERSRHAERELGDADHAVALVDGRNLSPRNSGQAAHVVDDSRIERQAAEERELGAESGRHDASEHRAARMAQNEHAAGRELGGVLRHRTFDVDGAGQVDRERFALRQIVHLLERVFRCEQRHAAEQREQAQLSRKDGLRAEHVRLRRVDEPLFASGPLLVLLVAEVDRVAVGQAVQLDVAQIAQQPLVRLEHVFCGKSTSHGVVRRGEVELERAQSVVQRPSRDRDCRASGRSGRKQSEESRLVKRRDAFGAADVVG